MSQLTNHSTPVHAQTQHGALPAAFNSVLHVIRLPSKILPKLKLLMVKIKRTTTMHPTPSSVAPMTTGVARSAASGNWTSCCNDPDVTLFPWTRMGMPALIYNGSAWAENLTLNTLAAVHISGPTTWALSLADFPSATGLKGASSTGTPASSLSASSQSRDNASVGGTNSQAAPPSCQDEATKIGLGVGLGVGGTMLAGLVSISFLLVREKRSNRDLRQHLRQLWVNDGSATSYSGGLHHVISSHRQEMPATEEAEMATNANYGKLPPGDLFG